jgi:geranylgeranyl diphosphate synthase, type II
MYQSTKELSAIIEKSIETLPLSGKPENLYDPMRYIISLGGKRMRPLLTLMGCQLFKDDVEQAINPALAIECFHNFTLIHDDIMDLAPLRRGSPTVHIKWNNNIGILSGDALYVKAIQLMMHTPDAVLRPCMDTFNTTALEVCEGQQLDMIRLKTAVLLGGALKVGALIGGAREEDANALYKFGEFLGIAFQLQDDILDVYGNAETFGKQVGGDIIANKKTYLLLKAKQIAHKYQAEALHQWEQATEFDQQEKVKAITEIFDFLEIRKHAEKEMENYYQLALRSLNSIPVADERKQNLLSVAEKLMVRIS